MPSFFSIRSAIVSFCATNSPYLLEQSMCATLLVGRVTLISNHKRGYRNIEISNFHPIFRRRKKPNAIFVVKNKFSVLAKKKKLKANKSRGKSSQGSRLLHKYIRMRHVDFIPLLLLLLHSIPRRASLSLYSYRKCSHPCQT